MAIDNWHIPSWTGDFELQRVEGEDSKCKLVVEDPTPAEQAKLGKFLRRCRQYKWIDDLAGIANEGRTELKIGSGIAKCGKYLVDETMPDRGRLTAIRSKSGTLVLVTTSDDPNEAEKVEEAASKPEAETAVTAKRPTKCCPHPIEGPLVRSSKVLRKFCTPRQWSDWCEKGWLIAYGHLSGHAYRIVHRHHPAAAVQGKICWDLDDSQVLHAHDNSVPPAEEVLTFKLILENIEPWLRCRATGFGPKRWKPASIGFVDPSDTGFLEGTWDAGMIAGLSDALQGFQAGTQVREVLQGRRSFGDIDPDALETAARDLGGLVDLVLGDRRPRWKRGPVYAQGVYESE